MAKYKSLMTTYEGKDIHQISSQLKENECEHILIVYDERKRKINYD
ncbi:14874_t:CDS:2 [Funneliformis geosporum]|nr:14874_t:CDS:2 [Funneliformis geosporum]